MKKSKFGMSILCGAILGGTLSLLDRTTREQVVSKSKKAMSTVRYYSENRDVLKSQIQAQKEKYQLMYEKFSDDASYIKDTIDEIKRLTPQVKELVVDTKEAIVESKEEYKAIVQDDSQDVGLGKI